MVWKRDKMKESEQSGSGPDEARATSDGSAESEGAGPSLTDLEGTIDVAVSEAAPEGEPAGVDSPRRLHERIRTLTIQLDAARVREDELTGQVVELEGIVGDLRARIDELELEVDRIEPLTTQIAELQEAIDKEARRSSDLAEARAELETEANRLSAQVAQLTELIDEAKADAVAETARAVDAEERLGHLLASHESTAREHEEELARLRTDIASAEAALEAERNESTARATQLEEQAEALRTMEAEAERRVT
ncbi:MAG TPA: hypothetical protein VF351_01035, partial [Actinomycetota bacterium]